MKTTGNILVAVLGAALLMAGCGKKRTASSWSLDKSEVSAQMKTFVAEKKAQEGTLIEADKKDFAKNYPGELSKLVLPDCEPFFAAAEKGDWLAVSNLWSEMRKNTLGLGKSTNGYPHGMWWEPVSETYGAIEAFAVGNEKSSRAFGEDVIRSIPDGSIYFGGTDQGHYIIMALQKSRMDGSVLVGGNSTNFNGPATNHVARLNPDGTLDTAFASPFYILTQSALADGTYLNYLRSIYGSKIYIPTPEDSQKSFSDYMEDVTQRQQSGKLKPGEEVHVENGRVQISGYVAVMEISALLAKTIFDKNPDREFYLEEGFPFDWMYPYLEPHGLIMKINPQPLTSLSDEIVRADGDYWTKYLTPMIGGWLDKDTPVKEVAAFAEKIHVKNDWSGFAGDPQFVQNAYSCVMFSKLRSSQAGLYAWRALHAADDAEKKRMNDAADFAFRQAWALCPHSPETVFRYVNLLTSQDRRADALLVAEAAAKMPELQGRDGGQVRGLITELENPANKFK